MGDETPGWPDGDGALNWAPARDHAATPQAARTGPWSSPETAATPEPVVERASPQIVAAQFWPWRIAIGTAQGLLFFALLHTSALGAWPGGDPYLFTALVLAGLFVPLLLLEGVGRIALSRLLPFAGIAMGLLAGLGWYHRWRLDGAQNHPAGLWLLGLCAVALFIVQAALHGRERAENWRVPYADLFDASWSLAARLLLWSVITIAGAMLLQAMELSVLRAEPVALALLALVSALAFQAAHPRIITVMARMLSAVAVLLLPMAAAVALLLISTALGQGPASLPVLLTVLAALTLAISASHGDGAALDRNAWRGGFEIFASFLLLVLAGITAWSLDARVAALGWTSGRIFAATGAVLFIAYGAGYSAAAVMALLRDGDMRRMETANVALAGVVLLACLALASPLADPLRLASGAQVARLERGEAQVARFDFANLATDGARFGAEALARLSNSLYPDIARAAASARGPLPAATNADEVGGNIAVHTPGAHLPATLLARDWNPVLGVPACLSNPRETCDGWFRDLNGDGRDEILLVSGSENRWWAAVMQADEAGRWSLAGRLASGCGTTLSDLRGGRFDRISALPGWNELTVAGNRVAAGVTEAGCSHY